MEDKIKIYIKSYNKKDCHYDNLFTSIHLLPKNPNKSIYIRQIFQYNVKRHFAKGLVGRASIEKEVRHYDYNRRCLFDICS